jgi:hypothetical protein
MVRAASVTSATGVIITGGTITGTVTTITASTDENRGDRGGKSGAERRPIRIPD